MTVAQVVKKMYGWTFTVIQNTVTVTVFGLAQILQTKTYTIFIYVFFNGEGPGSPVGHIIIVVVLLAYQIK